MATIKSYTDISQSKKLAEILPHESADMCYEYIGKLNAEYRGKPIIHARAFDSDLPCWSFSALLGVLPKSIPHKDAKYIENRKYWVYNWLLTSKCLYYQCTILLDYGGRYDDVFAEVYYQGNPVDACYEMVLKLHELNLL